MKKQRVFGTSDKALKKKFSKTIEELTNNNKVFLVYPVPQPPEHTGSRVNMLWSKIMLDPEYYKKDNFNYKKEIHRNFYGDTLKFFNELNFENLYKIRTENLFCPENNCIFYDSNNIYYKDTVHLSYVGSKILIDKILRKIKSVNFN